MASDEILLKVALDLGKTKDQVQDLSSLWERHNNEIKKGNAAMQRQADDTADAYSKVNKKIKENISQVGNEGKAIDTLGKKFDTLNKKNAKSFDSKELDKYVETLKKVSGSIGSLDAFDISLEEFDDLHKKLSTAKTDVEALNVVVDFFDEKMKDTSSSVSKSFDVIKKKIEETKDRISSTEKVIKDLNNQIDNTAPGKVQSGLISDKNEANRSLNIQKGILSKFTIELKNAREESVSMTTQLRKVKDELIKLELEGGRGSDRWKELASQASKYNEVIKDTNAELNRTSSSTAGLQNLIGAATGIVALFTAAQGAAALFGEENEDLQKSLVKVTGAIALLNGLQQIQTELTKKETLAGKAATFVQLQYATATNGAATATARLVAVSKLLGIGLLIGAIAYLATNWKDVAKWIGITSEKSERLNDINKKVNESYGEQIAKLTILIDKVKKGGLSFDQQKEAVKNYNEEFSNTLGAVKSYSELQDRLITNGPLYIQYLQAKAKAEAASIIQVELMRKAMELSTTSSLSFYEILKGGFRSLYQDAATVAVKAAEERQADVKEIENDAAKVAQIGADAQKVAEDLAKALGIVIDEPNKKLADGLKTYASLLEDLVKKARDLKNQLIENDREREKSTVTDSFNAEKDKYRKEIELLKVSNKQKLEVLKAFNEIYNEETGLAYAEYRKTILAIDKKYDDQEEEVRFTALSAIASAYDQEAIVERLAIQEKYKKIRIELQKQIDQTNDVYKKEDAQSKLDGTYGAEERDIFNLDTKSGIERVDREQEIANSILKIQQSNMRDILKNEKIKQLQLLAAERDGLKNRIKVYQDAINDEEKQDLFADLTATLETSLDNSAIEDAKQKLIDAFGNETAIEILKTVDALKEVGKEINEIGTKSKLGETVSEIAQWTSSLEGFGTKLGESLGLEGEALGEFAKATAQAIDATFQALSSTFQAEIDQRQAKVDAIQENIDIVEQEVEKEKQLYEDGYANNYELRQKDLEDLKAQKAKEEEELVKAQKKKAALNKVEMIGNLAVQLSNVITAITEVTKAHAGIPFVGIALAIGFIASMFAAIASAKSQAAAITGSGQSFRRGIQEGHLDLHGPRHEESGFGLYNSKTGERIAEFEDSERLYTFNKGQLSKYGHIMEAIMKDAQGRGNIDTELGNHYGIQKTGQKTIQIIRHVNEITIKANHSKERAAKDNDEVLTELKHINNTLKSELDGFKKQRDESTESWETTEFHVVKKGNVTKKYPKK